MTNRSTGKSEHRLDSRFEHRIKLRFRSESDRWRTGITSDLSFGGMYVSCKRLPEGADVEIKLAHGRKRMVLKGKVVRTDGKSTGLARLGFAVKLIDQPESWLELCRSLRAGFSRRRRTTEFSVPTPGTD